MPYQFHRILFISMFWPRSKCRRGQLGVFKSFLTPSMDASRSSPCSESSDEYLSADEDCSTKDGISLTRQRLKKLRDGENGSETASGDEQVG